MIIYVTPAEFNGGILQFSTTILRETKAIKECKLFLPEVVNKQLYEDIFYDVVVYNKVKTLQNNDSRIHTVALQIMSYSPELVVFLEDSILMQQLNEILHKNKIKTAMVIHDIHHHPYRKMGIRQIMVDIIRRHMTKKTIKHCTRIILLSKNSEEVFRNEYHSKNTVVFRLPAHVPEVPSGIPKELTNLTDEFFLFFGRIDEYKGINHLCAAYSALPDDIKSKRKLVIAGKGCLSDEEKNLIGAEPNIRLISRFIEDKEMVWLFENSKAIIMPYIEASQSGVLPIAYKFGKPVIVSNLKGLTENVLINKTGCVFSSVNDLTKILEQFDSYNFSVQDISDYYEKNYLWKNNLEKLFQSFQVEVSDG